MNFSRLTSPIITASAMLNQKSLTSMSMPGTQRGASKLSAVNVRKLVEEILNSLKHISNFSKINFEIEIEEEVEIITDRVLMLSVFQNLIHNAINYCSQQNPWIRIKVNETE